MIAAKKIICKFLWTQKWNWLSLQISQLWRREKTDKEKDRGIDRETDRQAGR
jgi:hypothetical protein